MLPRTSAHPVPSGEFDEQSDLSRGDIEIEERIVLAHKYAAPGIPTGAIARPRLDELFARLLDTHPVLVVSSPAGSGKSVQAQLFATQHEWDLAWLTLDRSDASPSRFLSGLAVSIERFGVGSSDTLHTALRSGAGVQEAAATLAGTIGDHRFLLVIDEGEHLALDAALLPGLATFLEYAPDTMRAIVLSREALSDPVRRRVLEGTYATVTDRDLHLTLEETQSLLEAKGLATTDAQAVFEATGGWMAGLVFGSRFDVTAVDQSDEFCEYLRDEIVNPLPEQEQEFLVKTSIANVVTPGLAAALLGPTGRGSFVTVKSRHLPAVTTSEGLIVYHSVLRSFLRTELAVRYPLQERDLLLQGADHFRRTREFERATEWFIASGDLEAAAGTAECELAELYRRSDWTTLSRWLDSFGEEVIASRPLLLAARIRSMFGLRQFDEVVAYIRRADQRGQLRSATEADHGLLATVGWALQADAAEARRYLDRYEGDYRVEAVRYMLDATTGLEPSVPPVFAADDDVVRVVSWGLLWQGRLGELVRMAPATEDMPVMNPNLILAYLWRGDIEVARAMWARVPHDIRQRAHSRFIEACILHAEGDASAALAAAQAAVADSRRIGFSLDSVYEVFAALIMLSLGSTDDAVAILERKIAELAEAGDLAIVELAQTVLGLALLQQERAEEARLVLEECVRSMGGAQRRLFFPAAAVYLSEAHSRLGNDDAAHEWVSRGYHTASLIGSFFWLVEALRAVPGVLERADDRDPSDSRWRRLLFSRSAHVERTAVAMKAPAIVVDVQTFGPGRDLIVNGHPVGIGRLKVIELAACLSLHPDGIDRFELQRRLFPDVDQRRGGNHFRQIAHKLRESTGLTLGRSGQLVTWPDYVLVEASDVRFERIVVSAMAATGRNRFELLHDALAGIAGGYLESSDLPWVEERRYHLDVVREEALLELAQLALDLGEPVEAREAGERVVDLNPYCEKAYVLLMRVENLIGTATSCQAVFRRAIDVLGELGLEPPPEMVELVRAHS